MRLWAPVQADVLSTAEERRVSRGLCNSTTQVGDTFDAML
jgi:hypothetical protein